MYSSVRRRKNGWNASVRDMLRLGVLLIHEGVWDGQRLLDADWIQKMTHAAFEDANTGYGYLTWLGATCAPFPIWPRAATAALRVSGS